MKKSLISIGLLFLLAVPVYSVQVTLKQAYVISKNGLEHIKVGVQICQDEPGYYIYSQPYELYVPKDAKNVKFYDIYGEKDARFLGVENDTKVYEVIIPRIDYGETYLVGYMYKPQYLYIVRYGKNYHFYDYVNFSDVEVYLCIPQDAQDPAEYDHTYLVEEEQLLRFPNITLIEIPKINITLPELIFPQSNLICKDISICPEGYKEVELYYEPNTLYELKYHFSLDNEVQNTEFTGNNLIAYYPEVYKDILYPYLKEVDNLIQDLKNVANLKVPELKLYFTDDLDKIFEYYDEDTLAVAYSSGYVFYKIGYLLWDYEIDKEDIDPILLYDILRGVTLSSVLNTYNTENIYLWFTNAFSNYISYDMLKRKGYNITKIEEVINESLEKEEFKYTQLLVDLSKRCPGIIYEINRVVSEKGLTFSDNIIFNNFFIFYVYKECGLNLSNKIPNNNPVTIYKKYKELEYNLKRIQDRYKSYKTFKDLQDCLENTYDLLYKGFAGRAEEKIMECENFYLEMIKIIETTNAIEEILQEIESLPVKTNRVKQLENKLKFVLEDLKNRYANISVRTYETEYKVLKKNLLEIYNLLSHVNKTINEIKNEYKIPTYYYEKLNASYLLIQEDRLDFAKTLLKQINTTIHDDINNIIKFNKKYNNLSNRIKNLNSLLFINKYFAYKTLQDSMLYYNNREYEKAIQKLNEAEKWVEMYYIGALPYTVLVALALIIWRIKLAGIIRI